MNDVNDAGRLADQIMSEINTQLAAAGHSTDVLVTLRPAIGRITEETAAAGRALAAQLQAVQAQGAADLNLAREISGARDRIVAATGNGRITGTDDPAAQAERDRLMPQACGRCGGEVPRDGAPPDHLPGCPPAGPPLYAGTGIPEGTCNCQDPSGTCDGQCAGCGYTLTGAQWGPGTPGLILDAAAGRYFIVVVREPGGALNALSRRQPGPDGQPFTGPWGALTEDQAGLLAAAYNDDPRAGGAAEPVELSRFDRDPEWTEV